MSLLPLILIHRSRDPFRSDERSVASAMTNSEMYHHHHHCYHYLLRRRICSLCFFSPSFPCLASLDLAQSTMDCIQHFRITHSDITTETKYLNATGSFDIFIKLKANIIIKYIVFAIYARP